jgi:hypothetical protein
MVQIVGFEKSDFDIKKLIKFLVKIVEMLLQIMVFYKVEKK